MKEAVIVTGGRIDSAFCISYIKKIQPDMQIAVDSGLQFYYQNDKTEENLCPDWIIGDFDSVDSKVLDYFQNKTNVLLAACDAAHEQKENVKKDLYDLPYQKKKIQWLRLQPEKDDTDTEAAILCALSAGCTKIHLLGASGSRLDHVLGNIHLLGLGFSAGAEIIMADEKNRIRLIDKGITIKKAEQFGSYVSLLPFTPKVCGLTLTGMKYPLWNHTLTCYHSLGISNEIVADTAEIRFTKGVLLVLETKD